MKRSIFAAIVLAVLALVTIASSAQAGLSGYVSTPDMSWSYSTNKWNNSYYLNSDVNSRFPVSDLNSGIVRWEGNTIRLSVGVNVHDMSTTDVLSASDTLSASSYGSSEVDGRRYTSQMSMGVYNDDYGRGKGDGTDWAFGRGYFRFDAKDLLNIEMNPSSGASWSSDGNGNILDHWTNYYTSWNITFRDALAAKEFVDGMSAAGIVVEEVNSVPEPASLALMGLGGLATFRRRRRAI